MITCSVHGCQADRDEGDSLFCPDCRNDWTNMCLRTGIKEVLIPVEELEEILDNFQRRYE